MLEQCSSRKRFEPRSHFKSSESLTLNMTTAQVVETSVTVNNNSPIQDYVHPDDQTQPTFEMLQPFETTSQQCCNAVLR